MMIDFSEIPEDGEVWELFARDFLQEHGFFIESSPDRGPDGGKDLIVSEQLKGQLGNYRFRWLVSCKHFAKSGKSVQERDELNIRERIESHNADGFIGFYSTIPSSGFNSRLRELRQYGKIKDFKIFDHQLIESILIRVGFSQILMRYFPTSYKIIKPLHLITGEYIPLKCAKCQKDLLKSLYEKPYEGNVVFVKSATNDDNISLVEDVYWCCKGDCDHHLRRFREGNGRITGWEDIGDLVIPTLFVNWIFSVFNVLRNGNNVFTDEAFAKLKSFIVAIAQKNLREMTEKEKERAVEMLELPYL